MAHTQLLFRAAAMEKVLRGASALADAVRITLGPKSKCVLIDKKWARPLVCNDGVTIAKEVNLKDPAENLGARMMREAAERTGDAVGDGTSTSTILAHAIFVEGLRNVTAGASAIGIKRGLDRGLGIAVESLRELSRPVQSRREKAQVATISGHNDAALGELVADAMERVGNEGVVSVEEAKATETSIEVVEGMQFDRGFLSPYFITSVDKRAAVLESPAILLCEQKISIMKDLLPLLEEIVKSQQPLLIIAEDVDGEALATLVLNKLRGVLSCAAVKAPGFGDRRKELLQDIAVLTDGQVVTAELGLKLASVGLTQLGRARRVIIDKDTTTIIGGGGAKPAIAERCALIRTEMAASTADYERQKLAERLAKLASGVAVIRVGAPSEIELQNRKEALEDAISATKAAIAEGIVPGGGLAQLRVIDALDKQEAGCAGDERTGLRILKRALEEPARQIARNSSVDDGVVVDRMRSGKGSYGFDAGRGEYVDLMETGIIDPTKVVRIALESAVSVASVLLLSEATLTEIAEPAPKLDRAALDGVNE